MPSYETFSQQRRTLIFINILITCIASSLLATALTTALPPIIEEFQISMATGQWLTSAYSMAMGIIMPLTAFLITRFPTKKLYLTGIICFTAGLCICSVASSFSLMMGGRILQACGNGVLTSMAQVILLTIYPAKQQGSIMGWYGLAVGAAPVIAPTLAGILIDYFSWRMIFYISIVIMLVSFIFAIFVFDDFLDTAVKKFDILSFILSAFAFGGITLGIGNISSYGFAVSAVLPLLLGIVTAVLFVYRQFHQEIAFLELRILKYKNYALSVIGSMLLYFIMMGASILMPLYIQSIMGYSATICGLVLLPGSLLMAFISPFAGKIYDKFGMKLLFTVGAICLLLGNLGMVFVTMETTLLLPTIYNTIRNIAIGCLLMPLVTWGIGSIKREATAHGTALLNSLRTIAGAIGSAVSVGVMTMVASRLTTSLAILHGLQISFLMLTLVTGILLLMAIFGIHSER